MRIDRLTADVPDSAKELILDLYRRMPPVRIADILLGVDAALGFTEAFTHLRTGVPCGDQVGLLNVLLAEGLNLRLRKIAEATNTHDYWQLCREPIASHSIVAEIQIKAKLVFPSYATS